MASQFLNLVLTASLVSILTLTLMADEEITRHSEFPKDAPQPWFTGPLLAPSGQTVKPGNYNIQPYVYFFVFGGGYDNHWQYNSAPNFYRTVLQIQTKFGLTKWLDIQISPQFIYNSTQGQNTCDIGDLPVSLNIQLFTTDLNVAWPSVKLGFRGWIPLGKYQDLKASKLRTDATGIGSILPSVSLVFGKLWHAYGIHYVEGRLAVNYRIGTDVHVKGINTYGGASNTHGKAFPGNGVYVDGSLQYNLSQKWALACDFYYTHGNKSRFSGYKGTYETGSAAIVKRPSFEQFSLAPAIEYNWSENLGIIGGSWFTLGGRNASQFTSAIVAVNIHL